MFLNLIISLVLNLGMWFVIWYLVKPQAEPYLLHYNIFLGIDLIGEWWRMFFIPALGAGILLVNFVISFFLLVKEKILTFYLTTISSAAQVFLILALIFIFLLNN